MPDDADTELDPSWLPEIQRRIDDIMINGDAVLDDVAESNTQIRAELADDRR